MATNTPVQISEGFSYFPKLPPEIKIKVWNAALEEEIHREGRVVEVRWNQETKRYISNNATPVLLRTCRDSRIETRNALNLLTIAVEVSDPDDQALALRRLGFALPDEQKPPFVALFRTYFNFDLDTIFLSQHHFATGDPRSQQPTKLNEFLSALNNQRLVSEKIRRLAFSGDFLDVEESGRRMYNMKALENVMFVFDDRCCFRAHGRSAERHNKLIKLEEMKIPSLPVLQNQHNPNNTFANTGINAPPAPQTIQNSIFGYLNPITGMQNQQQALNIPQFNAGYHTGLSPLFGLSEADKHALKVQAIWHSIDDELVTCLEDGVADWMGQTQGNAREEWSDLKTSAVIAIREVPPKVIKDKSGGVGFALKSPKRPFLEGYEVTVNGRPVRA